MEILIALVVVATVFIVFILARKNIEKLGPGGPGRGGFSRGGFGRGGSGRGGWGRGGRPWRRWGRGASGPQWLGHPVWYPGSWYGGDVVDPAYLYLDGPGETYLAPDGTVLPCADCNNCNYCSGCSKCSAA